MLNITRRATLDLQSVVDKYAPAHSITLARERVKELDLPYAHALDNDLTRVHHSITRLVADLNNLTNTLDGYNCHARIKRRG